jgi:hypothetical protein
MRMYQPCFCSASRSLTATRGLFNNSSRRDQDDDFENRSVADDS